MNDLVSIVVPVYNVEQYVSKCIDSILGQTYDSIEVILVDDGSTDSSGKICDYYADHYKNVNVIHKDNGGLSSARNAGMEIINGKYIMFVDSDDWIEDYTVQYLINLMVLYDADMTAVRFNPIFDKNANNAVALSNKVREYNKTEALESFLFNGYLSPCACGKLWKKESWNGIRFPNGKLFEDQYTIYKVLDRIEKSVLSENKAYNYLKRENSIGHSKFNKKTYDLYYAINQECRDISLKYPELKKSMIVANITWKVVFVNMMLCSDSVDNRIIERVKRLARRHLRECIACEFIPAVRKLQILLFAVCFPIYNVLYGKYKVKHKFS